MRLSLAWRLCYGRVGPDLPPAPSAHALHSSYAYIFHSISVQERKLQDLEVELETRTKDVKAKLAQLDLQVREQELRIASPGALDLGVVAPQGELGASCPLDAGRLELARQPHFFPTPAGGDRPKGAPAAP